MKQGYHVAAAAAEETVTSWNDSDPPTFEIYDAPTDNGTDHRDLPRLMLHE